MNTDNESKTEFDHPPSAEEILAAYQATSENDPASVHYKRINIRPKLHPVRALFFTLAALAVAAGVGVTVFVIWESSLWAWLAAGAVLLIAVIAFAKRITVWCIKAYQRFAPDSVRNRCRFEPSCSQYMIIAIEKYGLFKGLKKGLGRLRACRPPNGGIDMP